MTDQKYRVRFTPLSSGDIEQVAAPSPRGDWDPEMDKEREARVKSLQLISELLIKNRRLAELLSSVNNCEYPEFVREYEKNV